MRLSFARILSLLTLLVAFPGGHWNIESYAIAFDSADLQTPTVQFLFRDTGEGRRVAKLLFKKLYGRDARNQADIDLAINAISQDRSLFGTELRERIDIISQSVFEHREDIFGITDHSIELSELDKVFLRAKADYRLRFVQRPDGSVVFVTPKDVPIFRSTVNGRGLGRSQVQKLRAFAKPQRKSSSMREKIDYWIKVRR